MIDWAYWIPILGGTGSAIAGAVALVRYLKNRRDHDIEQAVARDGRIKSLEHRSEMQEKLSLELTNDLRSIANDLRDHVKQTNEYMAGIREDNKESNRLLIEILRDRHE